MTYKPDVPESPINTDRSRCLPEETDVRTYVRLFLDRSLSGREGDGVEAQKESNFARMHIVPSPEERGFLGYNWARTLGHPSVQATLEPKESAHPEVQETWRDTSIAPYTGYISAEWPNGDRVQGRAMNINSAADLRYNLRQVMDTIVTAFVIQSRDLLLDTLREGGFVFRANERQLVHEIELRQAQYPQSQLITFVGSTAYNFYRAAYDYTDQDLGSIIVECSHIEPTEVAVITPEQVRMRQDYTWAYTLERISRYWKVKIAVANLMGISVDPRSLSPEVIRTKSARTLDLE